MKRIFFEIIFIISAVLSVLIFSCKNAQSLELNIDFPLDGSTIRTNLIKLTGSVSNPEAVVKINGTSVSLFNDTFSEFVQLEEGNNQITASASTEKQTKEKSINVTFVPTVAVFLSPHKLIDNSIIMNGNVFPPQGTATVNGNPVIVDEDGMFSSPIQLSKGNNIIRATAEYAEVGIVILLPFWCKTV